MSEKIKALIEQVPINERGDFLLNNIHLLTTLNGEYLGEYISFDDYLDETEMKTDDRMSINTETFERNKVKISWVEKIPRILNNITNVFEKIKGMFVIGMFLSKERIDLTKYFNEDIFSTLNRIKNELDIEEYCICVVYNRIIYCLTKGDKFSAFSVVKHPHLSFVKELSKDEITTYRIIDESKGYLTIIPRDMFNRKEMIYSNNDFSKEIIENSVRRGVIDYLMCVTMNH